MKNKFLLLLLCCVIPTFSFEQTSIDQATFKVGKNFFDRQLYSEAEGRFLDIVRKYPDSVLYSQTLLYLGETYTHKGEHKSALQYYKMLLTKSKTITEKQKALLGIAQSWLQIGDHHKAGDFYAFYATEYPESEHTPSALFLSGIARERGDNLPAALEKYRTIINDYQNSEYYTKAIEKIAVLDNTTPESMWASTPPSKDAPTLSNNTNMQFEDTDLKAQSTANIATILANPSVITQMVQAPPIVVTQVVAPQVVTQIIEQPHVAPSHRDELVDASIVYQKDGVFSPALTTEQKEQQQMLENYKKIWEEEYQLKIKQQELEQTEKNIKNLIQLSEDKAKVLKIKELSLQEQKDRIQNNAYTDLNNINIEHPSQFSTPPIFMQKTDPPIQGATEVEEEIEEEIEEEDDGYDYYYQYGYDYDINESYIDGEEYYEYDDDYDYYGDYYNEYGDVDVLWE